MVCSSHWKNLYTRLSLVLDTITVQSHFSIFSITSPDEMNYTILGRTQLPLLITSVQAYWHASPAPSWFPFARTFVPSVLRGMYKSYQASTPSYQRDSVFPDTDLSQMGIPGGLQCPQLIVWFLLVFCIAYLIPILLFQLIRFPISCLVFDYRWKLIYLLRHFSVSHRYDFVHFLSSLIKFTLFMCLVDIVFMQWSNHTRQLSSNKNYHIFIKSEWDHKIFLIKTAKMW